MSQVSEYAVISVEELEILNELMSLYRATEITIKAGYEYKDGVIRQRVGCIAPIWINEDIGEILEVFEAEEATLGGALCRISMLIQAARA